MTLEQFLNLFATILGLFGSVYVLRSFLQLTPQVTERLVTGRYGHNPELIDSLSGQRAESVVGSVLFVVALLLVAVAVLIAPFEIIVHATRLYPIIGCFLLAIPVYYLCNIVRNQLDARHRVATVRVLVNRTLDRLFKENRVTISDIKSLRFLDHKYLHLELAPHATPREFIHKLVAELGRSIPDGLYIEGDS